MSAITKEGIEVRIGQLWRDLDKRMAGRTVSIVRVAPEAHPYPYAEVRALRSGRMSRLRINRMHKHATGFALVCEEP